MLTPIRVDRKQVPDVLLSNINKTNIDVAIIINLTGGRDFDYLSIKGINIETIVSTGGIGSIKSDDLCDYRYPMVILDYGRPVVDSELRELKWFLEHQDINLEDVVVFETIGKI